MSWQNRAASQILHEETVSEYPFIQYVNDGSTLTPAEPTGGFAMAADQVEVLGAAPHGATEHTLTFSNGAYEAVHFTDWLRFAPLVTRFAWIKDGNRLDTYVPGARGKLQALGYVETEQGFAGPVMLTVKGMASKDLSQALREHRQAVRKATQGQAPSPFFSILLHAGKPTLRGAKQKSRATPIVRDSGFDPDRDYVGDALADAVAKRHHRSRVGDHQAVGRRLAEQPRPQRRGGTARQRHVRGCRKRSDSRSRCRQCPTRPRKHPAVTDRPDARERVRPRGHRRHAGGSLRRLGSGPHHRA